jgi:hypothetical protein
LLAASFAELLQQPDVSAAQHCNVQMQHRLHNIKRPINKCIAQTTLQRAAAAPGSAAAAAAHAAQQFSCARAFRN